jgi:phosphatidylserine/phosphatidylglycerophosphate/cardiolipin synthase-like enzyme
VAATIVSFLDGARKSLDLAMYDLRLEGAAATAILDATQRVRSRGVSVRIVFNQDHARKSPDPPPPAVDWDFVKQLGEWRPVPGIPDLMHHKYVVRDGGTPDAVVFTGSTNWTTDSWTREENVLMAIDSAEVAGAFSQNFEELWETRNVASSGHFSVPWMQLASGGENLRLRVFFAPGRGMKLVHEIAHRISIAERRVRICSPVITAGPVLGTLADLVERPGLDISGVYDRTQMDEVRRQWSDNPAAQWKLKAFETVAAAIPFGAKVSTPYSSGSVHDFMHAKATVCDDTVFCGSYNLSHSGEENAENVVEMESPALADLFTAYIDRVSARYGRPIAVARP